MAAFAPAPPHHLQHHQAPPTHHLQHPHSHAAQLFGAQAPPPPQAPPPSQQQQQQQGPPQPQDTTTHFDVQVSVQFISFFIFFFFFLFKFLIRTDYIIISLSLQKNVYKSMLCVIYLCDVSDNRKEGFLLERKPLKGRCEF